MSGHEQAQEQVQEPIQEPIQEQPAAPSEQPAPPSDTHSVALMQQITVEMPKQGFHVVDRNRWERIERRVLRLGRRTIDWLAAGWAFFGVAVSAGIALLVLPHATTRSDAISPFVRPALWAAMIAGALLWVVFAAFHFSERRESNENAFDICNEMRIARGADELPPPDAWWNLRSRRRRTQAVASQPTGKLREDGEVGMELDTASPAHPERKE